MLQLATWTLLGRRPSCLGVSILALRLFKLFIGPSLNIMDTITISSTVVAKEHGVTTSTNCPADTLASVPRHRPRVPLIGASTSFIPVLTATSAVISTAPLLRFVTTSIVTVNGMNAIRVILPATSTVEKNANVIKASISLCTEEACRSRWELTTWKTLTCRNL